MSARLTVEAGHGDYDSTWFDTEEGASCSDVRTCPPWTKSVEINASSDQYQAVGRRSKTDQRGQVEWVLDEFEVRTGDG